MQLRSDATRLNPSPRLPRPYLALPPSTSASPSVILSPHIMPQLLPQQHHLHHHDIRHTQDLIFPFEYSRKVLTSHLGTSSADKGRENAKRETISDSPEFNTSQAILPLLAGTSHVPSDPDILLTSTQRTYRGSVNPANMVQPPDGVIDYWFHRLGLSLDTPLAASLLDLPSLSSSVSVLGDIDLSVSHIVVILYYIH